MTKKILMIAYTNYSTDSRVIKEAEAAIKQGFNVDFICLRTENACAKEKINNVNVIRVKQFKYRGRSNIRYILSYIEFFTICLFKVTVLFLKKKYAIIHVNNMPDFLVFCAIIPKLFGAKVILDIHDPMPAISLVISKSISMLCSRCLLIITIERAFPSSLIVTLHSIRGVFSDSRI